MPSRWSMTVNKLTIVATVELKPGCRDEVLAALRAHRERCLRDEPGTLQFDLLVPEKEDDKILIYEVYSDPQAFKTHWDGPSTKTAMAEIGDRIIKMTGTRCTSA